MSSEIDGLVQERRNSSALALELRLSCADPSRSCSSLVQFNSLRLSDEYMSVNWPSLVQIMAWHQAMPTYRLNPLEQIPLKCESSHKFLERKCFESYLQNVIQIGLW